MVLHGTSGELNTGQTHNPLAGICAAERITCLVGDECHRATGKADIVLHNDGGTNLLLKTDGSSVTGQVNLGNPGASYNTVVTGTDLNGDGASDLLVQGTDGTLIGYTLDNNAAITAGAVLGAPGPAWRAVGNNPMQYIDGTTSAAGATCWR